MGDNASTEDSNGLLITVIIILGIIIVGMAAALGIVMMTNKKATVQKGVEMHSGNAHMDNSKRLFRNRQSVESEQTSHQKRQPQTKGNEFGSTPGMQTNDNLFGGT